MNLSFNLKSMGLGLGLFLLPWFALALELPADFKARYTLEKYSSTVGEMTLHLQRQDNKLIYQSHSRPRGLAAMFSDEEIDERSELAITASALSLLSYDYRRKDKAEKNQQFDISQSTSGQVTVKGSYGKSTFELQANQPLWDRLSVQLALMMDISAAATKQKNYSYKVIDKAALDDFQFNFIAEETVSSNNRDYKALKFSRHHGSRTTFLWLASELGYLPVKVEQYRKDELKLSMSLKHIQQ